MLLPALFLGLALLGAGVFLAWRYARRADGEFLDLPARLVVTTFLMAPLVWVFVKGSKAPGNVGLGIAGLGLVLVCGLILSFLWVPTLTQWVLSPLFGAWTGGDLEVERQPFYSRAIAHRKNGRIDEALAEIGEQLRQFPDDFTGLMLRSEIEAEEQNDLQAAFATLLELVSTPGRDPGERAQAQFRLAEWQQHRASDLAAARETLERLRDENPGSEAAQRATQRLAHLPDAPGASEPRRLVVREREVPLGLTDDLGASDAAALESVADPEAELHALNAQLSAHPDDWEARERRVRLFTDHLGRTDLAHEDLEYLIRQPGQPAREVVRWLNRVADLHLAAPDVMAARLTLDRIVDQYPGTAAAEQAERRIAGLGQVVRVRRETPTLKLGTYEGNPGLRWGRPGEPRSGDGDGADGTDPS